MGGQEARMGPTSGEIDGGGRCANGDQMQLQLLSLNSESSIVSRVICQYMILHSFGKKEDLNGEQLRT